MKDETQVKDEIILVVKEAIRDNTTLAAVDWEPAELDSNDVDHIAEAVADRLYANGYGDVAEWKKRAEVAERALDLICDTTMKNVNIIVFPDSRIQVKNKIELYNYFIQQAERVIEEEKNNGKK